MDDESALIAGLRQRDPQAFATFLEQYADLLQCRNCRVVLDTTQRLIVLLHDEGRRIIPMGERSALFDRLQQAFLNRPPASDSNTTV